MKKTTLRMIIIGLLILFSLNTYSNRSSAISSTPSSKITNTSGANAPTQNDEKKQDIAAFKTEEPKGCKYWLPIFKPLCYRLHQTWTEGNKELYFSGYAWHNRFTYPAELLREKKYNELAWGGGFGKGFFDEKGNWHGLYAIAFLDSHRNVEPTVGYAYLKVAKLTQHFKAGLGVSVLVTSRPDIMHNIPFPGAVPWAGVFYKKLSIKAAYIPGSSTNGNVLYLVGAYTFDK
ncbi:lipid IV(A) palmitoyltransferase PagP [Fluoribacter gormanii]|uniref:Antimicrobial peptide resistance and lipid A acylation PagP n=1 Tax=Fluoribacter gormanii TaxID=464 RepID=A0A377GEJ2_9GAMM|nr:lipid IV(A) palmitoyltransferase PagP [Fluoribacter gormanii]KTD00461.1 antimicrobial peptide resistance and Lipid A acylation protein PagP [Fluoribacter gormanii]MCW8445192.1 lipid IV(A) palmitoyltransferase PagP [Fluoribacter gormanii]MCW8470401.1 lipid IV(A) palmitoyltransferase PagP [Fluoribacter gormanii]SIR10104.1 Antimicrobial peptide resistance and lipid A acylation PagP [Fluoribacter gormanii]STO23237.1 Lipid A palmitoyltransferase PagP precursor [Fluoribacter gormanii]